MSDIQQPVTPKPPRDRSKRKAKDRAAREAKRAARVAATPPPGPPPLTVMPKNPKVGRPRVQVPKGDRVAALSFTATVSSVIRCLVEGSAKEIMCVGTRGDGKTIGVLGGMILHAAEHAKRGYPLPVKWLGVADTFSSHKAKTFESLEKPLWKGAWRSSDVGHVWTAVVNGQAVVQLHLFGIEDQGASDRVRTECHCTWFEEPAPTSVLVASSGVNELTWSTAITSQRLPTHAHVAVMTLNYPDEDHWTWQRFQPGFGIHGRHPDDATRAWFRIPPGERADATERAAWAHALRDRPDLLRRLIQGQPGTVMLGPQVADGFNEDVHVAKGRLRPIPNEPLALGVDFGHTPTVIIGQVYRGQRRIYAALACQRGGILQQLENEVLPWLGEHAPWALRSSNMVYGCYDIAGETGEQSDIERDPVSILEQKLPGLWFPGPVKWESRKHTVVSAMHHHVAPGQVSLQIDPVDAGPLVKALSGRWHYPMDRQGQVRRDQPKKPNHPWEDLGDAFVYWLWGLTSDTQPPGPMHVETAFSLDRAMPTEYSFNL